MALGCPVVAAPLTSLPEVGGDAALYADADDAEAWRAAMALMIGNDAARASAIAAGTARAALFSWETAARRHDALYREIGAA
jgi:glycosyltransferase involved in cell wall biosynthesis